MRLQVREQVCTYATNDSSEYPAFLEYFGVVLEGTPSGDSVVLLKDFDAYMSYDGET